MRSSRKRYARDWDGATNTLDPLFRLASEKIPEKTLIVYFRDIDTKMSAAAFGTGECRSGCNFMGQHHVFNLKGLSKIAH